MKRAFTLLSALLLAPLAALQAAEAPKGKLVIVGGGVTPSGLHRRMIEMAGGANVRVLMIGKGLYSETQGRKGSPSFTSAGAVTVTDLPAEDATAALAAVKSADVIWFGGGKQTQLMPVLTKLNLVQAIRDRYQQGAIIGGSSAGAAVMSKLMIAGLPKETGVVPPLHEGLGLWPEVIVDQHFLVRKREPRLLATVKAHPELLGVGIDESTFVIVSGDHVEVGGKSKIIVLDARAGGEPKRLELKAGDAFTLSAKP